MTSHVTRATAMLVAAASLSAGLSAPAMADETATPAVREWELWCMAVAIFILALMILVTGMDFSLGKLTLWLFG